ncbi:MAG: GNAT family N-acetyltransferase [Acidimicrobiales bacterium]
MTEATRPATADDLPRVAELARLAVTELSGLKGGRAWARREARVEPLEPALAAAIEDDARLALVGMFDGVVVGYAIAHVDTVPDGGLLALLDDLYVEPAARGVSVGEVLMDAVLDWATQRGCFGIDALALPGARETKNFFERFGLVARAIVVHRPL